MPLFPKKLAIQMSESEYDAFKTSIQHNTVTEFVNFFQAFHTSVSDSDVIALAIMTAIDQTDVLSFRKILRALPVNVETVITERADGKNLLLYAIEKGLIELVASYVFSLTKSDPDHQKYDADPELLHSLANAIKNPVFETHPRIVMQDVVCNVLTTESYDQLVEIIGQDWLDSYHM